MLEAGVEIYEYQGRMAHQKVATIDNHWSTVGSSNLDDRSLRINDELNLVVTDPAFARDLNQRMFDVDIAQSTRVTEADPSLRSRIDRLIHRIL
ncbi:MAG: phospholipase D-like domain-containing protein [Pseudomonadota bacterium]